MDPWLAEAAKIPVARRVFVVYGRAHFLNDLIIDGANLEIGSDNSAMIEAFSTHSLIGKSPGPDSSDRSGHKSPLATPVRVSRPHDERNVQYPLHCQLSHATCF